MSHQWSSFTFDCSRSSILQANISYVSWLLSSWKLDDHSMPNWMIPVNHDYLTNWIPIPRINPLCCDNEITMFASCNLGFHLTKKLTARWCWLCFNELLAHPLWRYHWPFSCHQATCRRSGAVPIAILVTIDRLRARLSGVQFQ